MQNPVFNRFRRVCATILGTFLLATTAFSQVDFEFWFAAPYSNKNHAPQWPSDYPYKVGGRPVYLRLATQDAEADVEVSLPALGVTLAAVHIEANSTETVDLTQYIDLIECNKVGNQIEEKGLFVRSNALITAYYEIASVLNTDIFSLKGQNALGKDFYVPAQTRMRNTDYHNGDGVTDNPIKQDSAFSYVVIVAPQNNTIVDITPTVNCAGVSAGSTKRIRLDKGQTYVLRPRGQDINARLAGTHIVSTKPVAVTLGEDSAYPDYFTVNNDCEDYIGDQIVPTSVVGKNYVVVQGNGYKEKDGKYYREIVAITATENNTIIRVNGEQYGSALNAGSTVSVELDRDDVYTFLNADKPVYAFQVSGHKCEVAGAILPSVDQCTGSYKMGFVRTYGSQNDQEFYMNLMVRVAPPVDPEDAADYVDGRTQFLLNGETNPLIDAAQWTQIDGTDWWVAKIYFPRPGSSTQTLADGVLPEGAYFLQNKSSLFHMGMMNSASHDWGEGQGWRLMGSMYAYFSRFSDNNPSAVIVNNNSTEITVVRNTKVSLLADGGYKFKWTGYMWNQNGNVNDPASWDLMPEGSDYLNLHDVENPYVVIPDLGVYEYRVKISTACYGVVERSVRVKVVEEVDLNNISDTVCYTPDLSPENDKSQYYNLFNLNDTIVGRDGLVTGFYVDHFERNIRKSNNIWDDFDESRSMSSKESTGNGSMTVIACPEPDVDPDAEEDEEDGEEEEEGEPEEILASGNVLHLVKTNQDQEQGLDKYTMTQQEQQTERERSQRSVWLDIDLSDNPIDLRKGSKFSFDIRYDGTNTEYEKANHTVELVLDGTKGSSKVRVANPTNFEFKTAYMENGKPYKPEVYEWKHADFDFAEQTDKIELVTRVRIRAGMAGWKTGYGYYIDNIKYESNDFRDIILNTESKKYTITEGDTLIAVVKNYFDVTRADTAMVYFTVKSPGKARNAVILNPLCATNGDVYKEFDFTQYNYAVGGALVADRKWYTDQSFQNEIADPKYVDLPTGTKTYYVKVYDECGTATGTVVTDVSAVPVVQDVIIPVCEVPSLQNAKHGIINLNAPEIKGQITSTSGAEFEWYSDEYLSHPVGSPDQVEVANGDEFYAKIFTGTAKCSATAKLTVKLNTVPQITFNGFEICKDADPVELTATPTGGVYSGSNAIVNGTFDPAMAEVKTHTLSYEVTTLEGCKNSATADVVVNPLVSIDLQNLSGKLQVGQTANLQATITPAPESDYTIVWDKPELLNNSSSATPTTKPLEDPAFFTVTATNNKTGCSATAKVLVDVYAPVKINLVASPICSGSDAVIELERMGGTGPFATEWTLTPNVPYTKVDTESGQKITIENAQQNVKVAVKVTDQTEGDERETEITQVVYANPSLELDDKTVCQGTALSITPTITGGTTPYTTSWSNNTSILKSDVSQSTAVVNTLDNVGDFNLTFAVVDKNGCKVNKSTHVKINQKPVVSASASAQQACFGDQVNLFSKVESGSATNATHLWKSNIELDENFVSENIPNPSFKSYIAGNHEFTYIMTDANGCKDTANVVRVNIDPRPTVTINPIPDVCATTAGLEISATPAITGEATFSYEWTGDLISVDSRPLLDVSTPGVKTIKVQVTANNGCVSDIAEANMTVNPNPLAEIGTTKTAICAGQDLEIVANNASANVSYAWESTATISPKIGDKIVFTPSNPTAVMESVEHTVTLTVTDNTTGCKSTTSKPITVYKLPEVSLGDDLELCDGASTTLVPEILYSSNEDPTITWYLDIEQLNSINVKEPTYTQTGVNQKKIGVEITDKNGCKTRDEVAIQGLENPTANAGDDRTENWGEDLVLLGSATGGHPAYSWEWEPKDSLKTSNTLQKPTTNLLETTVFTLNVTDSKGCKGSDEVIITIVGQPLSVTIVQKPDPFCIGSTATLEAMPSGGTGKYSYQWYLKNDPATVISTEKVITVNPTQATTYRVVINSVGEKYFDPAEASHTVIVYDLPVVSLVGKANPNVCQGEIITLVSNVAGAAPFTYEWNDGSPLIVKTEDYQFSNSQVVGVKNIDLTVTDANGCVNTITIPVTVDELPEVSIAAVSVCVNAEGTATATAFGGEAPYRYMWSGIPGVESVGDEAIFTIGTAGSYTINAEVIDAKGCRSNPKGEAIVTVIPETDLELEPAYGVCAGEDLTLDINPNGIPGNYDMQWVGGDVSLIVDKSVAVQSIFNSPSAGTYTLYYTIADQYGCPKKGSTVVTVNPAIDLAPIDDKIVCAGASMDIKAEVLSGVAESFTWSGNISPYNAQTTTFTSSTEGTYLVTVVAGDQNCSDTKEFNVVVKPNPIVEIKGGPIRKVDYMGEVEIRGDLLSPTTEPYSHAWTEAANVQSGANEAVAITVPILQTTDYSYQITDKFGCKANAQIRLQTEMIIPKITRLCDGTEVPIVADRLVNGDVVCLVDDALELCIGESGYLIPQFLSGDPENLKYAWKDDEGNALGNDINLSVVPTKEYTNYTLTVSNDAGFSTDVTFAVIAHPLPSASISVAPEYAGKFYTDANLVIDGNPASTEIGTTFTSHLWKTSEDVEILNPSSQRTNIRANKEIAALKLEYAVVDKNGCKATTERTIALEKQKIPKIIGDNVCLNQSTKYKLDLNYPTGTDYVWTVTGGRIIGNENSPVIEVLWEELENTSVSLSVYPPDDKPIENLTYDVVVSPVPDVSINGQIHVCVGESATYEAINNKPDYPGIAYAWSVVDDHGDVVDVSLPTSEIATVLWDKEGQDQVRLRASYGSCPISEYLTVYIHPTPEADFSFKPVEEVYFRNENRVRYTDSIFVDSEVEFTNLTPKRDGYEFYWDFIGDGVYSQNTYHANYEYDEVGDFMVQLMVVEDTWGCKNKVAKPLKVVPNPNCGMTFPNAFTPDLGENNTFYPVYKQGVMEEGYELRVYNRWGTLLWSTTDIFDQWDGVYKGSVSKQDVYVYHCKATCEDIDPETNQHRILNIKGDVTVIR